MAVYVYLLITGSDVKKLLKYFWRDVILTMIFPLIVTILIPILKVSKKNGFVCWIADDVF